MYLHLTTVICKICYFYAEVYKMPSYIKLFKIKCGVFGVEENLIFHDKILGPSVVPPTENTL